MNYFTRNYTCDDENCHRNVRFLTVVYSRYTVVEGKLQFISMNCFGATKVDAIDKANSIIDDREAAEYRAKVKAAKALKQGNQS